MSDVLEAALRYAELGYPVFPCANAPNPAPLTRHGFKDASTDPQPIERWWRQFPNACIGLATAGLLVVDIDERDNPWLVHDPEKRLALAAAPTSLTPGGGRHHIFRRPPDKAWTCTVGQLARHIDTRTDGGYIVVPPSARPDGQYRWVEGCELDVPADRLPEPPAWLVAELDRLATSGHTSAHVATGGNEANAIPPGQRNATLARLAGAMRRVGMSRAELAAALNQINRDRCAPPLSRAEVERIAVSVARYEPDQVATALAEDHWSQMFDADAPAKAPAGPGPFPQRLLAVPGFVGQVVQYNVATAIKPQPILALGAALALLGTLTGRKVTDQYATRTNVYCLGVCQSGGGKERARQVNKEILFQAGLDRLLGPEGVASHAGLVSAVEKQPALLFQLDEIGRLLKTIGEPGRSPHLYHIATVLMKLFTSSGTVYIGDAYADTKRNKKLHQPHACLYGTTVPQSLYESLTAESLTDGFLSRMLIFESEDHDPEPREVVAEAVPAALVNLARWWGDFNPGGNLSGENPHPRIVDYTAEARLVMADLEQRCRAERQASDDAVATLWTRTTEKARKLALIYACSTSHEEPVVDEHAASWAAELSEYLTRKMISISAEWVSETPFEAKRKRLLREIRRAEGGRLTRMQLCRQVRSIQSREREELITSLVETGEIVVEKEQTNGAPRIIYVAR